MKLALSCMICLLPCITGRRPRVVRPALSQFQKYHPSNNALLRHHNQEFKWTRPAKQVKTGILGDRLQITDYRLQDNRWNQYLAKKFPRFPPKKFNNPQKVIGRQKIKMVPVSDLRPHSIDKIDIYQPEIEDDDTLEEEEIYIAPENVNNGIGAVIDNNLQGNIELFEPNLQFGGVKVNPIGTVLAGERPVKQDQTNQPSLGGIKIYMFKGEEGLGVYDDKKTEKRVNDEVVEANINDNISKYSPVNNPISMFKGGEGLGVYDDRSNKKIINYKVMNDNQVISKYTQINNPINLPPEINNPIHLSSNIYNLTSNTNKSPQIRWSQSEVTTRPVVTEVTTNYNSNNNNKNNNNSNNNSNSNYKIITSRDIRPAPFPTRHTTRAPDKDKDPIIIIGQSVVESNMAQTTTWSPTQLYQT